MAEGGVKTLLRLEGLVMLAGAVALYAHGHMDWRLFAILFLAPDLSFLAYLFGPRVGAAGYNSVHAIIGPIVLAAFAVTTNATMPLAIALIWFAHIGFDRALGYGLKYATGFGHTHLNRRPAAA
jgi:Domain of unknown function (DUF4260)